MRWWLLIALWRGASLLMLAVALALAAWWDWRERPRWRITRIRLTRAS